MHSLISVLLGVLLIISAVAVVPFAVWINRAYRARIQGGSSISLALTTFVIAIELLILGFLCSVADELHWVPLEPTSWAIIRILLTASGTVLAIIAAAFIGNVVLHRRRARQEDSQ
jgi:hypothetical protein